jgi:acyl-CoA thioester hydrolase
MPEGSPVSFTGAFVSMQRVYWDQIDQLGVLHNAVYLLLFERARTDFWRSLGIDGYGAPGMDWPYLVVRNEVNYRAPIVTEQDVRVDVWVARLGYSSLTFGHELRGADGTVAADGQNTIVRVDVGTHRPTPWSDGFRGLVASYIRPE